jgi:hypothetical protein
MRSLKWNGSLPVGVNTPPTPPCADRARRKWGKPAAAMSPYRPPRYRSGPAGGPSTARFSRVKPASARLGTHGPAAAAANNSPISPCPEIPVDRAMGELLVHRRAERPHLALLHRCPTAPGPSRSRRGPQFFVSVTDLSATSDRVRNGRGRSHGGSHDANPRFP